MMINGLDVGKAEIEAGESRVQAQAVNIMGDKTVRARNLEPGFTDYTYTLNRLQSSTKTALNVVIGDVWKWAATPMTIIEDDFSSYTGYYWGGKLQFRRRAGPFWSTQVTFRRFW